MKNTWSYVLMRACVVRTHLEVPSVVQRVERGQVVQTEGGGGADEPPVGERDGGVEDDGRETQPGRDLAPGDGQLGGQLGGGSLGEGEDVAVAQSGEQSVGQTEGGQAHQSVSVQLLQTSEGKSVSYGQPNIPFLISSMMLLSGSLLELRLANLVERIEST